MFEIMDIQVGPETLTYRLKVTEGHVLATQDDPESVNRVLALMPGLAEHVCINPKGDSFKDTLAQTDVAHLLEHVVVELSALSGRAELVCGKTRRYPGGDGRIFETVLSCEDDTLTMAALSSGIWVLEWAFAGGKEPAPQIMAIAEGLGALIDKIDRVPHRSTTRAR